MTRCRETIYSSDRERARLQMAVCIIFLVLSVQFLVGTASVLALTPFCSAYLVYINLPIVLGETKKNLMFNIFISCFSVFVLIDFLRISRPGYKANSKVEYVIIARMKEGQIPLPVLMMMLLPTMATPVGMSPWWAKVTGLCCLVLFSTLSTTIYHNVQGGDDEETTELRVASFMHDLCFYISFIGVAFISSLRGSNVSESYVAYLHAGSLADSILNHILKASPPHTPSHPSSPF